MVINIKLIPKVCIPVEIFPIIKINNEILKTLNLKDLLVFYEKMNVNFKKEDSSKMYEFIFLVN